MRTPREVVELYNYELWNKQAYAIADEIIADHVVRHEIGSVRTLTRQESLQRVIDDWARVAWMEFTLLHLIAEGELVTIVYQCDFRTFDDHTGAISSIEVFRVVDGQVCEVWNAAHSRGEWH